MYLTGMVDKRTLEKYEREGSPYFSTARLWDDGLSFFVI